MNFLQNNGGKNSARVITQNHKALAFLDVYPLSLGHKLIIPKEHFPKQDMNRVYMLTVFDLLRPLTQAVEEATGVKA